MRIRARVGFVSFLTGLGLLPISVMAQVPPQQEPLQLLELQQSEIDRCIPLYQGVVVKHQPVIGALIRQDYSYKYCREKLKSIDFTNQTLIGVVINSGACQRPPGLKYQLFKDSKHQKYVLKISYQKPEGLCRALSRYPLWLLAPNLVEQYPIEVEIASLDQSS